MNDQTKTTIDCVIKLAAVAEMKSSFVISKRDNTFVGIDIRFDPPLDLSHFPSIKEVAEIISKRNAPLGMVGNRDAEGIRRGGLGRLPDTNERCNRAGNK